MTLSTVTRTIVDGTNTAFSALWAKLSSSPSAAGPSDITAPVHALVNTSEALINPATSDNQATVIATLGATSGAAVITDANGTLQQYLRGLVKLIAGVLSTQPGASSGSGGISSTFRLLSAAASTNGNNVKSSAGRVYAIQGYNAAAAIRYLKLYNKASSPTVGTDTPIKTLAIPALSGFAFDFPVGYSFATGIGIGITTGSADNDTGVLSAGDILGLNVDYA